MSRDVITVTSTDPLTHVAELMAQRRIRHLPVIDTARLVGIVSATDVFHAVPLRVNPFSAAGVEPTSVSGVCGLCVADIMSTRLTTTTVDTPIESAASLMHDCKIGALPVVRDAALVGLITESDILRAFTEVLALRSTGARITFDLAADEDIVPLLASVTSKHRLRLINFISLSVRDRCFCVVRVSGVAIDAMLEDLWKSGHRIDSVVRRAEYVTAP